jgi:hypothetical protein
VIGGRTVGRRPVSRSPAYRFQTRASLGPRRVGRSGARSHGRGVGGVWLAFDSPRSCVRRHRPRAVLRRPVGSGRVVPGRRIAGLSHLPDIAMVRGNQRLHPTVRLASCPAWGYGLPDRARLSVAGKRRWGPRRPLRGGGGGPVHLAGVGRPDGADFSRWPDPDLAPLLVVGACWPGSPGGSPGTAGGGQAGWGPGPLTAVLLAGARADHGRGQIVATPTAGPRADHPARAGVDAARWVRDHSARPLWRPNASPRQSGGERVTRGHSGSARTPNGASWSRGGFAPRWPPGSPVLDQ